MSMSAVCLTTRVHTNVTIPWVVSRVHAQMATNLRMMGVIVQVKQCVY